jgi:hypothetical protein
MRVALTWYPHKGEQTVWVDMGQVPTVGDTVHIGGKARTIKHVAWVSEEGDDVWHAELSVT